MHTEAIHHLAERVRKIKAQSTNVGPSGLCFDWNLALAKQMVESGLKVQFIHGMFNTDTRGLQPHYWVECKGLIWDITADQFNHSLIVAMPPVYHCTPCKRYVFKRDETFRLQFTGGFYAKAAEEQKPQQRSCYGSGNN